MTIKYSQLLAMTWRALLAMLLAVALTACRSDEVAGIDGSGQKVDPIAPNEPEEPSIPEPEEPEPEPVLPDPTIAVEGAINGFGSVIVHGQHYDTSRANFYRNGQPASEHDFEVGDMVALLGFEEDGKLYARDVYFTPALSGRVESFDEQNGTLQLFGQTVTLGADTVIGADLDSAALWGEKITISGWQSDGQVRATRLSVSQREHTAIVRGNVSNIDHDGRVYVGNLWVDLAGVASVPTLHQGDLVRFEGQVIYPADKSPRYLIAHRAERVASALSAYEATVESVTAAGVIRNIAQNAYFTINGVQINISQTTQSLTPNVTLADLRAGQLVVVQGEPNANRQIDAHTIKVLEFENKESFGGVIDNVSPTSVTVDGMNFDIMATTAIVDIQQAHSRITPADLRVGEYVVLSAINYGNGYEALSIKRTVPGLNDFKYDGTDKVIYDWGFPLDAATAGNSRLYSARVHAAHPSSLEIEIGPWNVTAAEQGIMRRVQIKHGNAHSIFNEVNYTAVFDADGNAGAYEDAAAITADIHKLLTDGRVVWINMQATPIYDKLFAEKILVMVDRESRYILDVAISTQDTTAQ